MSPNELMERNMIPFGILLRPVAEVSLVHSGLALPETKCLREE